MIKITLFGHRGINLIKCFCSYVGTCHGCSLIISGTTTIVLWSDDCKICQEES